MNSPEPPAVHEYILIFAGLFGWKDEAQQKQLTNWDFYEPAPMPAEARTQLREQYYPGFREFLVNANDTDHLYIYRSVKSQERFGTMRVVRTNPFRPDEAANQPDIEFIIEKIELFFFPEKMGIFTLEIKLITSITLTTRDLNTFSSAFRLLHTPLFCQNQYFTLEKFVEQCVLNPVDASEPILISERSNLGRFSGNKLKTYLVIELVQELDQKSAETELFRLATHWWVSEQPSDGGHALAYYEHEIARKIEVFSNWQALCLFDTWVGLGTQLFSDGKGQINPYRLATWRNTYFRIYVYNLYFKFFLFRINADLNDTANVRRERDRLAGVLNHYNFEYISYNFLPNLIHQRIRQALEIGEEAEKLQQKIEAITDSIRERQEWALNRMVFLLTVLTILPNTPELAPLVNSLLLHIGTNKGISPNRITLFEVVLRSVVVLVFIVYYYRHRVRRLRNSSKKARSGWWGKESTKNYDSIQLIPLTDQTRWHLLKHFTAVPEAYVVDLCQRSGHTLAEAHAQIQSPGSKFTTTFANTPDELVKQLPAWLNQSKAQRTESPNGRLEISLLLPRRHYPEGIGTDGLVAIKNITLKDVKWHPSPENPSLYQWAALNQPAEATNELHVILQRQAAGWELITVFCGTKAQPFPNARYPGTYVRSLQFWHRHALRLPTPLH